jgi:hypothetical protein
MKIPGYYYRMQAHRWMLIAVLSCTPLWPQAGKVDWAVLPVTNAKPQFERVELKPGEQQRFEIARNVARTGTTEAFPYTKPHGTATWLIEPAGLGVTVSAGGMVAASTKAKPGKYILTVTMGSEWYKNDFRVYDPQALPLKGNWTEKAELSRDGREVPPASPLRELIVYADGNFSATWFPFETRRDYGGTYTYDVKSQGWCCTRKSGTIFRRTSFPKARRSLRLPPGVTQTVKTQLAVR